MQNQKNKVWQFCTWYSSFVLMAALHIGLLMYFSAKSVPASEMDLSSAVMLEFSENIESIMTLHDLPVGPPQVASVASQASAESQQDDSSAVEEILEIEPPPTPQKAEIEVAQKKKKKPKPKPQPKPAIKQQTVAKKVSPSQQQEQNPSESQINSAAVAQSTAASEGSSNRIAAPYDSRSQAKGSDANWKARVLGYLARNQGYPSSALVNNQEGIVKVKIIINAQGYVQSVTVQKSSGHAILDQHAVNMIQRKSPLPAPPIDILGGKSMLTLNIPLNFNIKNYRKSKS
ncbi:hypothetical protein HMPREF3144_03680 [Oligella sp. HMSC05A10]|uniref:energy transducer TonB n=1 Tax=Oligella sp. HMSC05A10 TaxID=1581112 RepID=UPI0008A4D746|nr:energy transducer TonB [Oligella sp. HMSC05A10]OFS87475.1 hypothetical protein HMPREF3144_03680 [Oligella sp. HMSC05A10]